jgi:hypothetical protein
MLHIMKFAKNLTSEQLNQIKTYSVLTAFCVSPFLAYASGLPFWTGPGLVAIGSFAVLAYDLSFHERNDMIPAVGRSA